MTQAPPFAEIPGTEVQGESGVSEEIYTGSSKGLKAGSLLVHRAVKLGFWGVVFRGLRFGIRSGVWGLIRV